MRRNPLPELDGDQTRLLRRAVRVTAHQGKAKTANARRDAIAEMLRAHWAISAKQAKDIAKGKIDKLGGKWPKSAAEEKADKEKNR